MQEFRPASVVAADTDLARRLHDGDREALRALVERYGAALTSAVTPAVGRDRASDITVDVFVAAQRRAFTPGNDFAPWLAGIASEYAGDCNEQRWALAMAVAAIDADARPALRDHHVEARTELDDDLVRHELRLQRRLAHIGEPADIARALADPDVWIDIDPNLSDLVVAAVDDSVELPAASVVERTEPSRVTRGLRPMLLGLCGAALVLLVAIVGLSAASGTPESPDITVELIPTGALLDVEGGEINVTERDAGIEIELDAITLPRRAGGLFYEGRVLLEDGAEISAGTFAEGDDVTLWAGVALRDAVAFRIVLGDIERIDADDVVLKADLPRS